MIDIQIDSRKVKVGDTYVAIVGEKVDGHNFIDEAIRKGAKEIIAEHGEYEIKYKIVEDTKEYLKKYLKNKYQDYLKDIKLIGITGTNGKTTTAYLTYQMLNSLRSKTAYIGTLGFYMNNKLVKELNNTTPSILEIYKLLIEAKRNNCKNVIMEVSSHALDQDRLYGLDLDIGAFTNMTQDHLDYHKTMDNYLTAKILILTKIKLNGEMVVNVDDDYSKYFISSRSKSIGMNGVDYKLIEVINEDNKNTLNILIKGREYLIKTNLQTMFNAYNFLMAIAITNLVGYTIEEINEVSLNVYPPKGRCDTINYKNGLIVIDYAHTPDAVKKIIEAFKKETNYLITIIGCGGDRDKSKRPIMGNIVTDISDKVIFTSDNPRYESEIKIIEDILKGVNTNNYEIEYDRRNAIKMGIELVKDSEILLILGKGHENYQVIKDKKYDFDDRDEVLKLIKSVNNL